MRNRRPVTESHARPPVTFHVSRFTFLLAGPGFLRAGSDGQTDAGDAAVCDAAAGLLAAAKSSAVFKSSEVQAFRRLVLEKWPFFLLAADFVRRHLSGATPRGSGHDAPTISAAFADWQRLDFLRAVSRKNILAGRIWPLFTRCPIIGHGSGPWRRPPSVVLGGISWLVWRTRRRCPYLLVGWLWFLGTLVPVIGLVQVGSAAMADRYTYFPLVGVFIAVAFGVRDLADRFQFPKTRRCRRRRFDSRGLSGAHRKPIALLARQRIAFRPRARGHQETIPMPTQSRRRARTEGPN